MRFGARSTHVGPFDTAAFRPAFTVIPGVAAALDPAEEVALRLPARVAASGVVGADGGPPVAGQRLGRTRTLFRGYGEVAVTPRRMLGAVTAGSWLDGTLAPDADAVRWELLLADLTAVALRRRRWWAPLPGVALRADAQRCRMMVWPALPGGAPALAGHVVELACAERLRSGVLTADERAGLLEVRAGWRQHAGREEVAHLRPLLPLLASPGPGHRHPELPDASSRCRPGPGG